MLIFNYKIQFLILKIKFLRQLVTRTMNCSADVPYFVATVIPIIMLKNFLIQNTNLTNCSL